MGTRQRQQQVLRRQDRKSEYYTKVKVHFEVKLGELCCVSCTLTQPREIRGMIGSVAYPDSRLR